MMDKVIIYIHGQGGNVDEAIIPFKDHINIEAEGLSRHACEFEGCKYTTKGMLQIQVNQIINFDVLKTVFSDTYM